MARSSFGKREREQTKRAKATAKRERRLRSGEPGAEGDVPEAPPAREDEVSTAELLEMIAEAHRQFDAGTLSYEDFEVTKADLLGRLPVD